MPYGMNCMRVLRYFKNVIQKGNRACLFTTVGAHPFLTDARLVFHAMKSLLSTSNAATWRLPLHTLHVCHAADNLCLKIGEDFPDEKVLFMSDILCTAWHGTELGQIGKGDTVAIWGQGPGRFACFLEVHSYAFVYSTMSHAEKATYTFCGHSGLL